VLCYKSDHFLKHKKKHLYFIVEKILNDVGVDLIDSVGQKTT
jgi:hypothetical protein